MAPDLDGTTQAVLRVSYGMVLLGSVCWNLLQGRRFFLSERWGGYGQKGFRVDALQNPVCYPVIMALWLCCALGITLGEFGIWPALINVLICRYYFVAMRWSGNLRGMGAPGFMTYWLGFVVLLLEFTVQWAPEVKRLALWVIQADWAAIMITAGIYKFTAGYPRNEGMELGMANPQWGIWWQYYVNVRPSHPVFWFLNQMAWSTEIIAGVLMLIPGMRWIGGIIISISFLLVGSQIRLNQLTLLLALTGLLFLDPASPPSRLLTALLGPTSPLSVAGSQALSQLTWVVLVGYAIVLPVAYAGLYYNFYARRKLGPRLQWMLECYTNFFGMIIWRVFSVNLIDFFIRVHVAPRNGQPSRLVSTYGWGGSARFNHVGESIAITTVFTTLKYYPHNTDLFNERLVRYARTISSDLSDAVIFEYVTIRKAPDRFNFVPMAEYRVDLATGEVSETLLRTDAPVRSSSPVSRISTGSRPGSYAPV